MGENDEYLSKTVLMVISVCALTILVVGVILLALGYNEAFYSDVSILRAIFGAITYLGEAIVLIIVIALFYVAYDKKFGKNLAFNLVFSLYLNSFLKEVFQDGRPPANTDPTEEWGMIEPGYGFPSGHSQMAVTTWGYIGYEFKDKGKQYLIPVIFSTIALLIAISRIVLGMHDLQDIIGGLLFGIGFLLTFIYLEPTVSEKIGELDLKIKLILAAVIPIGLFLLGTLLFPSAGIGLVKNAPLYPDEGGFAQACGAMLGVSLGYLLENEYVGYEPSELDTKQKLLNIIIGMVILFVLYFGLELVLHGSVVFRFLRYAIVAFVLILLAPFIFTKINKK